MDISECVVLNKLLFAQVEQLVVVNDTRYRDGSRMPNLVPAAQRVVETTDRLSATAERIAIDTKDDV